jgi:hypothetical protein
MLPRPVEWAGLELRPAPMEHRLNVIVGARPRLESGRRVLDAGGARGRCEVLGRVARPTLNQGKEMTLVIGVDSHKHTHRRTSGSLSTSSPLPCARPGTRSWAGRVRLPASAGGRLRTCAAVARIGSPTASTRSQSRARRARTRTCPPRWKTRLRGDQAPRHRSLPLSRAARPSERRARPVPRTRPGRAGWTPSPDAEGDLRDQCAER